MRPNQYGRDIVDLNFYEDNILFPDEAPQDIIGFCVGLTGKPSDPHKDRYLNITCRRVNITQEYTDIRREVGNLLLRLWDKTAPTMDDFWVNTPRKLAKQRDRQRARRIRESREIPIGKDSKNKSTDETFTTSITAVEFAEKHEVHEGAFFNSLLKRHHPELHQKLAQTSKVFQSEPQKKNTQQPTSPPIYVNGLETHKAPLLDIVRPTLFIYTMDSNFVRFVDECVIPKAPSNRLNPYNRNLRLWFDRRVLGWYSKFNTEIHADGGEFWYDLKVEPTNIPPAATHFKMLMGSTFSLADPGEGMGGGERFP